MVEKNRFYELSKQFVDEGGKIVVERGDFQPHKDYSGYGITIQVRGKKTKEVIDELEEQHAIHPRKIGIELENGENLIKFEMTNRGRISFSSGDINSIILIIAKYVEFLRKYDESYEYIQSRFMKFDKVKIRQLNEIIKISMPSIKKIRGTIEERNAAIISKFTSSGGEYGYIGIPIGSDRANILDLKERKTLQLTIVKNDLYIYSENPSESRSAIRRLVSEMASHIDPDIIVKKISFGGN